MKDCASFDFSNLITWLVVILGWFVVYRQSRAFQDRKELRSALDKLTLDIDRLKDISVTYHTVESEASSLLSNKIKSLIKSITANILGTKLDSKEVQENIVNLRKSITLKNFDSHDYNPMRHNSDIVLEIFGSSDDLKESLELRYNDLYKKR